MLRKPHSGERTVMAAERIVPLDRARTLITLLVVLHHSVINYTYFGDADRMRWLGFDLIVLFNDSFFMACMFFISGLSWQPGAQGTRKLHGQPRLAIGRAVFDLDLRSDADRLFVFTGTLSMSWALTVLLRKIPAVARTI